MRIEIDFDNKTIEVKDSTTLGALVDKLKELDLKDWKSYKIKAGIEYVSYPRIYPWTTPVYPLGPIYITPQPTVQPYTPNPLELPYTICSVNN
jgi:hypothetical protein